MRKINSAICRTDLLYEIFAVLKCYEALMLVSYRRFGTTYQSHLQGSSLAHEDRIDGWVVPKLR